MTPWNTADPVYSFVYRADGLRIKKVKQEQQDIPIAEMLESGPEQLQGEDEEMKPVWIGYETNYLYDGQMPVCEQEFEDGVLKQTRIHLLGARGIEGIITVPATGSELELAPVRRAREHGQNNEHSIRIERIPMARRLG